MNSPLSYSLETLKLGQYWRYFASCDLEISQMTFKNNRASLLCPYKLYVSFHSHQWILIWVTVRKHSNQVKFDDFFAPYDLEISKMTLKKTIGHLFYTHSSFRHHFIAIDEFRFELQSGNSQIGSYLTIFCLLWPWNFTDDLDKHQGTFSMPIQALCIIL